MILIDSNILIYSADEKYKYLRDLFKQGDVFVSIITRLEVLGYHKITPKQVTYFETIFQLVVTIQINDALIDQAIAYRQKKSMSVADSIIAATAKLYQCDLYTNNGADFKNIKDFKIVNPL
ncbi:MAG TPA: type II toxin-antitoxin system VapC family toxin [Hanamia sp.]